MSVGGILTGLAISPVIGSFGGIVSHYVDAKLLPAKYDINYQSRTLLPDINSLLDAYYKGSIDKLTFHVGMMYNNARSIPENGDAFKANSSKMWQSTINANMPRLSLVDIIIAWRKGLISKDDMNELFKGFRFKSTHQKIMVDLTKPTFNEGIIFGNYLRGNFDKPKAIELIRRMHNCNETQAKGILDLSQFIPPVQDLIRFSVRDVYNPQIVQDEGLDDEYMENKEFIDWAASQGIGQATIVNSQGEVISRDIPKDYWRAHWDLMSPTQGYTALHRFRENRLSRYNQQVPNLQAFDIQQMELLLKRSDYLPKQRKWLAASSYLPVGRIDLRRLYESDIIDDNELYERYQDVGYVSGDASELVAWSKQEKKKKKDKEKEKKDLARYAKYRSEILSAYADGSVSRDNAANALLSAGLEIDDIEPLLRAIDVRINRRLVLEYIKQVRAEFFLGAFDGLEAYAQLTQGGVDATRASQLVQRWNRQQTRKRKVANTGQLIEWYKQGFIDVQSLSNRLQILGWDNADIMVLIAQGEQKRTDLVEAQLAKQERESRSAVNAQQRLIEKQQREARAAISRAMQIAPPARLMSWYVLGIMTADEIIPVLRYYGWGEDNIQRFMTEAELKRNPPDEQ